MSAPFWQTIGLEKIISGGQTGTDIGALRAALTLGIPTGGTAAGNYWNERGFVDADWLCRVCHLGHNAIRGWRGLAERTETNIRQSDATIVFSDQLASSGTIKTLNYARFIGKPVLPVAADVDDISIVWDFLRQHRPKVLNIAGNRESVAPGIEQRAETFFIEVLR